MRNGKSLTVSDFTIDLSAGELTGAVNSTTTRVAVFTLDLSEAKITTRGNTVTFTNVGLFAGGLRFGSAFQRPVLDLGRHCGCGSDPAGGT